MHDMDGFGGITEMDQMFQEPDQFDYGINQSEDQLLDAPMLGGAVEMAQPMGAPDMSFGVPAEGFGGMPYDMAPPTGGIAGIEQIMQEADQFNAAFMQETEQMVQAEEAQALQHSGAGLGLPAGVGAAGANPQATQIIEQVTQEREQESEANNTRWDNIIKDA